MKQKWSKDDEDRGFVGNDEIDKGEEYGRDVRLFTAHQFDCLGNALPFPFQLFAEADDQNFQTQQRGRLQQIFQLSHGLMRETTVLQNRFADRQMLFSTPGGLSAGYLSRRPTSAWTWSAHGRGQFRWRFDRIDQNGDDVGYVH